MCSIKTTVSSVGEERPGTEGPELDSGVRPPAYSGSVTF